MRKVLFLMFIVILVASCKKETTYQLQVLFKNNTADTMVVFLYPRTEYQFLDLYDFCDFCGGYADTRIVLFSKDKKEIYITSNLEKKPSEVVAGIFDSIHIQLYDAANRIIRFTQDTVTGYPDNPFWEDSSWVYEKNEYDEKTSLSKHPVESHDYIFEISE